MPPGSDAAAEPEAIQEAEPEAIQEAEPEAIQEAEPAAIQEAEPAADTMPEKRDGNVRSVQRAAVTSGSVFYMPVTILLLACFFMCILNVVCPAAAAIEAAFQAVPVAGCARAVPRGPGPPPSCPMRVRKGTH